MVAQISQNNISNKPLGIILMEAGLISDYQIKVALKDQQNDSSLLFGEILALRGWIQQETADFFAIELPKIKAEKNRDKNKITDYLKQAKLLTDQQIDSIIKEKQHSFMDFCAIAVKKGYLKQKTLDFLSNYLFSHINFDDKKSNQQENNYSSPIKNNYFENKQNYIQAENYIPYSKGTYIQWEI